MVSGRRHKACWPGAGGDAGDIVGGGRGPVDCAERRFRRFDQMLGGFVRGERLRRLDDDGEEIGEADEREVEPDEPRALQPRLGDRLAERAAGDALAADRKAAAGEGKLLMVDVEAERDALAAFVAERQQALAAEVERQARLLERPIVGNARFGREAHDVVAARPRRADGDRRAVATPAVDVARLARAPEGGLAQARLQALEALVEFERHGGASFG